jgi:hypothetical protein
VVTVKLHCYIKIKSNFLDPVDISPQMTAEKLLAVRAIHPKGFVLEKRD